MVEERITQVETPRGGTHTTTIVTEPRRSGAGMWIIVVVLVVLGVLAFMMLSPMSKSEVAKNDAIAGAANSVGNAADNVGNAAKEAADSIHK